MPIPALFVGRWLSAEQAETLMQWFAVIGLFRGTCAERRETSLVYVGASNTTSQTLEHHVPCHNTTLWETARYIEDGFSCSQNRAPAACCV